MAHAALHFSVGMAVGTAATLRPALIAIRERALAAPALRRMLVTSYLVGLYAAVPGLLDNIGMPAWFCEGWWMNLFLFHPLINAVEQGGSITGSAALLGGFALQYGLVLTALARRLKL